MVQGHTREQANIVVGGAKHAAQGALFMGWLDHIQITAEQICQFGHHHHISEGECLP